MGTFANYTGDMVIPDEKKELFRDQMGKVLYYGGMMRVDAVNLYGQKVCLLQPIGLFPGDAEEFHFNYFEDRSWESAFFHADKCRLSTNKIGSCEFNYVILAAYILYEMYDETPGLATLNGDVLPGSWEAGWLNQILGTHFSMDQRFPLWETAERFALQRLEYYDDLEEDNLLNMIPGGKHLAAGGADLADLFYIVNGTDSLAEDDIIPGSYPDRILCCKKAVSAYLDEAGKEAGMDALKKLACTDRSGRAKIKDGILGEIAQMSLGLPARVIIYLAAELAGLKFWVEWQGLKDSVYHDEQVEQYASDDLLQERADRIHAPISPVRTSEYLRQDGPFTFWGEPEELRDKPNYYLSDNDRLYWWREGSDEVVISESMDNWLKELAGRHKEIKGTIREPKGEQGFLKDFLQLFSEANEFYIRIYPFTEMFYEFIQNGSKKEYAAAVELFRELVDENKEEGQIIEYARDRDWDLVSKNITCNIGRLRLKRYLSVMANRELRRKYFGF